MKLQFLGTGAAEGIPAVFCECEACEEIRRRGNGIPFPRAIFVGRYDRHRFPARCVRARVAFWRAFVKVAIFAYNA